VNNSIKQTTNKVIDAAKRILKDESGSVIFGGKGNNAGVGDVKLLPEPQISPRRAAALEKQRIAAQGTGGSGGVDFIGTESGTSIHAIQSELKTSLTNAGATRIGPSTLTTETGEIFHMNTGNGPMEIRIMDGRVGGGPLQGPRTIITRPGTKEYIYPNGARIEGAVPLSTRKQIGHIHGQR
ncbi:MAG: hypothetical protein GX971_11145, partial [Firmicutes bacterium]|nr:hypothetical protein [Bacillota bacterium]